MCALMAACVHLLTRLHAGYPGYCAIKQASEIRQWYQKETKQVQWYQSRQEWA
jgi:hypothetical protein